MRRNYFFFFLAVRYTREFPPIISESIGKTGEGVPVIIILLIYLNSRGIIAKPMTISKQLKVKHGTVPQ